MISGGPDPQLVKQRMAGVEEEHATSQTRRYRPQEA